MNPFLINFAFLGILVISASSWFIVPVYNLHILSSNVASLKAQTQRLIDNHRSNPDRVIEESLSFRPYGLKLNQANYVIENDFLIYRFEYNPLGLFGNKFASRQDYEGKTIILTFMIDR
jgi:hypothetical protein